MSYSDKTKNNTPPELSYSQGIIQRIENIVENHKSAENPMSSRTSHCMYDTVDKIKTHQNQGFHTPLADEQEDDRESFDIISPMIETVLDNMDTDVSHLETYVARTGYNLQSRLMKSQIRLHAKQTNLGIKLDEAQRKFVDDGNIIVREDSESGEYFSIVDPLNIFVTDQSAQNFEETGVVEYSPLTHTTLMRMKNKGSWKNVDKVIENLNIGTLESPLYEIFYYFDEISELELNEIKKESGFEHKDDSEVDPNKYVVAQIVAAKGQKRGDGEGGDNKGVHEYDDSNEQNDIGPDGEIVFVEQRKPEEVKISEELTVTRYKPYEIGRYEEFNNRLWSRGCRETAFVYQERANEIGTRIARVIRLARALFYTDDPNLFGMNVLSSLKDGQVVTVNPGRTFQVLNNQFPNFNLLIEEWNRNLQEARRAIKAFQVATGEQTPSSATATAVSNQAQAVGKFFNKKRERFGMFLAAVFSRWVIPKLKKKAIQDGKIMVNDSDIMTELVDSIAAGMKSAGKINLPLSQIKARLLSKEKFLINIKKTFYNDVDVFVGLNTSGQTFNKQNKISNGMVLLQQWANPAYLQNPVALDILKEITYELGVSVDPNKIRQLQQQMEQQKQMQQMMQMMQQQQEGQQGAAKPEQAQAARLPEQEKQKQEQQALQGE